MPVNNKHPEYDTYAPKWKRCRDVYAGEDAIHKARDAYLPRLKDQEEEDYVAYVGRATFYNATYRTIVGLNGMLFRQPPKVEVPETVKPFLDDITLSGVPFQTFVENVAEEALKIGRIGVFVDYPAVNVEGITQADSVKLNLRPTIQMYFAETIINWRVKSINNKAALALVVLRECEEIVVDEFTSKEEERFRVLDLVPIEGGAYIYRVRMFKREKDKDIQIGADIFPLMGGKNLDYIPFIFIGTDDITPELDDPPLIDLINLNISHYRSTADYEHGAHFTGLPTPILTGYTPADENKKLYIGSQAAWVLPNKDAKAYYLEFSGKGLETLEKILTRKETQMAILGARMLEPQKRGVESADSVSIHRKGEDSMLASVAQTLSLAIEQALDWFVSWCGVKVAEDDVAFDLNRDFYPVPMSPQMLSALVATWQQGGISRETLFKNLQQGEIVEQDKTLEDELTQIDDEQAKMMQGAADAAALAAGAIAQSTGQVDANGKPIPKPVAVAA